MLQALQNIGGIVQCIMLCQEQEKLPRGCQYEHETMRQPCLIAFGYTGKTVVDMVLVNWTDMAAVSLLIPATSSDPLLDMMPLGCRARRARCGGCGATYPHHFHLLMDFETGTDGLSTCRGGSGVTCSCAAGTILHYYALFKIVDGINLTF